MKKSTKYTLVLLVVIFMTIGIVGINKKAPTSTPVVQKETDQITITITGLDQFQYEDTYEYEKQTVYDLLVTTLEKENVEIKTKGFGEMIYISSINGLAEFDYGARSGWMYQVNGEYPNIGCGSYQVQAGDQIEWIYVTE